MENLRYQKDILKLTDLYKWSTQTNLSAEYHGYGCYSFCNSGKGYRKRYNVIDGGQNSFYII